MTLSGKWLGLELKFFEEKLQWGKFFKAYVIEVSSILRKYNTVIEHHRFKKVQKGSEWFRKVQKGSKRFRKVNILI